MFRSVLLKSLAAPLIGLRALLGLSIGGGETAALERSNGPPPVWVLRTGSGGAEGVLTPGELMVGATRGGKGGRVVDGRVGEVGGDMMTSSLSGKLA